MSHNKSIYLFLSIFSAAIFSCTKSEFPIYEQKAGLYFNSSEYSYSFVEDITLKQKSIKLVTNISGDSVNYDREFTIQIPEKDTITTAEKDQYVIGKGIIPAGSFTGSIEVKLNYDKRLDDSIYNVRFEIAPNPEFPQLKLNKNYMTVKFTAKVIQPVNWKWLRYYFGDYSTNWWKFVIEKTGKTSFPYFPNQPDPENWPMSAGEVEAYKFFMQIELNKYNATHETPFTHEDGAKKDLPVVMPI